jgi:ribosomal protein L30/L7E
MTNMLAAIRIKGRVGNRKVIDDTLHMLGMKKPNTMAILPRTDSIIGMLKKVEHMITWGEADEEMLSKFKDKKIINLKPPSKGFRSVKQPYPKGDTGYRGKEINQLIKRMV